MKKIMKLVSVLVVVLVVALQVSVVAHAATKVKVAIVQLVTHPSLDEITQGIKDELAAQGYKEGDNLEINFQNAEGDMSLLSNISELVVAEKPDVIFAITTPVAQSLQEATSEIPIVLAGITDPVSAKLVDSLEKPGANITGVSDAAPLDELFALVKAMPIDIKTIGMLYTSSEVNAKTEVDKAKAIAEKLGYKVEVATIDSTNDMQLVAETLVGKVDAVFVPTDNSIASSFDTLLNVTEKVKKPVFPTFEKGVQEGALASVAINQKQIGKQSAELGVKVLKGQKTADTPVEFAKQTKKVFNKKTAEALSLTLPESLTKDLVDVSGE